MTPQVNLLPAQYRQSRRRNLWFRMSVIAGATILTSELCAGIALHMRATETRDLLNAAATAQAETAAVKQRLTGPSEEAQLLTRQITLAARLRTSHPWSRLLSMLARATPERVVLTAIATDPPKWSSSLRPVQGQEGEKKGKMQTLLGGLSVRGYAVDHADLSALMTAVQASGAFASIDLKEARRDKYREKDAIAFELLCHW